MNRFAPRTDKSVLGRWWWTVDRLTLSAILILVSLGILMVATASPAVAERIGLPSFHFLLRHIIFLIPAMALLFFTSLLSVANARRLALLALLCSFITLIMIPIFGTEVKGASRWIYIFGFSLQPSEFLKPAFIVTTAWLFSREADNKINGANFPGTMIALGLWAFSVALLISQPDLGMTTLLTASFFVQFFLAGLGIGWIILAGIGGIAAISLAYIYLPHVTSRIDRFLDPASGDTYQIDRSIQSFGNGGLFGQGIGQGDVKLYLPDAHTDFIFAVGAEEMGLIFCIFLIIIYLFIILRGLKRLMGETEMLPFLAAAGILVQLGLQMLIHMGSAMHLIPAKGMTLPLISYGGSSLIATGFALGLLLAFTSKRVNKTSITYGKKPKRKHIPEGIAL